MPTRNIQSARARCKTSPRQNNYPLNHRSFYPPLSKSHLLHNLNTTKKYQHRRTSSTCREQWRRRVQPTARHFNFPNHSSHNMIIFGYQHSKVTQKPQKSDSIQFIRAIMSLWHQQIATLLCLYKPLTTHNSSIRYDEGLMFETSAHKSYSQRLIFLCKGAW